MQHEPLPPFTAARCLRSFCPHRLSAVILPGSRSLSDTINEWFSTLTSRRHALFGHKYNVYACLVCGKYFQGRGKHTQAYRMHCKKAITSL